MDRVTWIVVLVAPCRALYSGAVQRLKVSGCCITPVRRFRWFAKVTPTDDYEKQLQKQIDDALLNIEYCERNISVVEEKILTVESKLASLLVDELANASARDAEDVRTKEITLQERGKQQLRDKEKQLRDEKNEVQKELRRDKREGDPVQKRAEREKIKTVGIIGQHRDGIFTKRLYSISSKGWMKLNRRFATPGFEEIPIDLIDAVASGREPKKSRFAVFGFSGVKNGSTYAPVYDAVPSLIAKVDESVKQLIGRMDNGVKADEDALGRLARELSPCFDNLAIVGIARSVWEWNDATLATRFADLIHEARTGGNETDLALTLDKIAAGKSKIMEFDAVLVGDDVVVLAELKSALNPDDVRNFANKVNQLRASAYFGNTDYAFFRGKRILPIVYGGFLGGPETRSLVVEIAAEYGLPLYSRSGLEFIELMAEPLSHDFEPQTEVSRTVRCDFIQQFLLEPNPSVEP